MGTAKELLPGIDVSHNNGAIDWPNVARAGIRFTYVKASEGVTFDDPMLKANCTGARKAGLKVGVYHFAHPSDNDPLKEAKHFAQFVSLSKDLRPMLDFEDGKGKLGPWVLAFLGQFAKLTGQHPGIYVSPSFWNAHGGTDREFSKHRLWIAHHGVQKPTIPKPWTTWKYWQFTGSGRVPGIAGNVDRNWMNPW